MSGEGKSKTIKPPGSLTTRVSVACDRCRKKKIRCFYDDNDHDPNKQCANCNAVGLQCIFSDKLARKAFPRGYTESLEERVRELEYENKKLQKLMTMKTDSGESTKMEPLVKQESMSPQPAVSLSPNAGPAPTHLNTANLSALNTQFASSDVHTHDEYCLCGMDHTLINRPVSIAGSVDIDTGNLSDDNASLMSAESSFHGRPTPMGNKQLSSSRYSFEQINAPGAAAAISLQKKLRTANFMNLANLIATSIPRSTDETLFIPTLLAKIVRTHGFDSRAPFLTARSIALLKEAYNEKERYNLFPITFKGINFNDLKKNESIQFFQSLNLPNHSNLEVCINIYLETWNTTIPILNKDILMENYKKFNQSRETNFSDGEMCGFEKFGELLVIITCLVMVSKERNSYKLGEESGQGNSDVLQFYDHLIKQFIQSNLSSICSISSLQIKTIELLYCLTTGDLNTSYEVRGKMITMCQQMRLHRCPAAVLGSSGSKVSKLQQGERRILFWCIYTLESFSAFILGVPRLLKDYEVECALPSASSDNDSKDSDINLVTFNNSGQLTLVGKVCESALEIMRFAKVLGTIVDTTFKRNSGMKAANVSEATCLLLEEMLNSWLTQLPPSVSFELIERGATTANVENYSDTQLTLMFLYYQAKALIYMALLNNEASSKNSPAFISTQQASTSLLTVSKVLSSSSHNFYFLPLPMNIARQKARFCLLAARNSLEYTRGGSLFQEAKTLLSYTVNELRIETKIGLLGCLSENCFSCLELAIDAILSQPRSGFADPYTSAAAHPIESIKMEAKKKSVSSPLKVSSTDGGFSMSQPAINDIFSSPEDESSTEDSINLQKNPKVAEIASRENNIGGAASHSDLFAFMKLDPKTSEQDKLNSLLDGNDSRQQTPDHLSHMNSLTDLMMMNDFGVDASLGLSLIDFELDNSVPKKSKTASNKANSVNTSALSNAFGNRHSHEYQHRVNYARSTGSTNFDFGGSDAVMEDASPLKANGDDLNGDLFPSSASKRPPSSGGGGTPLNLFDWGSR